MGFSRILLSTDFSECSREAAKFAGIIAKNFDSEIYLVHVLSDFRSEYASLLEETLPLPEPLEEEERRAVANLREEAERLREEGLNVEEIMLFGTPYIEILKFAEKREVDLIIMGTRGLSGLKELLLGSTALKVVRNSHIPVITVRKCTVTGGIKKVLFPTDLSDYSLEALPLALEFCRTMGAKITLFHVIEIRTYDPEKVGYFLSDKFFDEIKPFIEKRMGTCPEDVHHEKKVVRAMDATAAIIDEIRDNRYDLVVMATHGRTGFKRALLGSVAEKVLRHSPAPVMTVKPSDFAKKGG